MAKTATCSEVIDRSPSPAVVAILYMILDSLPRAKPDTIDALIKNAGLDELNELESERKLDGLNEVDKTLLLHVRKQAAMFIKKVVNEDPSAGGGMRTYRKTRKTHKNRRTQKKTKKAKRSRK
jgi:hypothetical protein